MSITPHSLPILPRRGGDNVPTVIVNPRDAHMSIASFTDTSGHPLLPLHVK